MRRKAIPGSQEEMLLVDLNIRSVVGILPSQAALDPLWHRMLERCGGDEESAAKAYVVHYLGIPHILGDMPGADGRAAVVINVSFPEPADENPQEPEYPRWQQFDYQILSSKTGEVLRRGSLPMRFYCPPSDFHYFAAQKWIMDNTLFLKPEPFRIELTLGRVLSDEEAEEFMVRED